MTKMTTAIWLSIAFAAGGLCTFYVQKYGKKTPPTSSIDANHTNITNILEKWQVKTEEHRPSKQYGFHFHLGKYDSNAFQFDIRVEWAQSTSQFYHWEPSDVPIRIATPFGLSQEEQKKLK